VSRFEDEWRARFERFASTHSSEASISGWSESGLERRVHLFRSLVPAASPGPAPVALELGCGAGTYVRILAGLGFEALATSSGASAGVLGRRDGMVTREEALAHARAIVEAGFRDFRVTPSQGSHFFQNLTAFQIGYFTVNPDAGEGSVDWEWLSQQPAVEEDGCVRHLQFAEPLRVVMNSRTSQGMIFKP